MTDIIDTLREEHRNIAKLLDILQREIESAAVSSNPDWDVLQGIADYFCAYPDRCHHPKEDAIYRRLQAKFPGEAKSIGDLLREHQDVRSCVQRFRGQIQAIFLEDVLPRERLIGSARAFIDAERQHMMKEEEIFFPAAERFLVEEDWQWIKSRLRSELDPLFAESVEHEFKAVRDRLSAWKSTRIAG